MKLTILDKNTVTIGDIDFSVYDKFGDVSYYDVMENDKVASVIGNSDAVILNKAQMTKEIISSCPNLKYIGLFATGYNNIDLECAKEKGIVVSNAPDYSTDSVVQHTFSLLLQLAGSIDKYASSVKRGEWVISPTFSYFPYPIIELTGKTMGVIGFGSIGKKVCALAKAFGMKVIVSTRTVPQNSEYEFISKEELFKRADVISINCPLNENTQKMISKEALSLMKETAILINTSRGGVIDEDALYEALKNKKIASAGLDVLTKEPMDKACKLATLDNCIITPHTAWASLEARQRLVKLTIENLEAFLSGKPQNQVTK